jgi:ribosomal protein S18 acetylase RimI-like enzyme
MPASKASGVSPVTGVTAEMAVTAPTTSIDPWAAFPRASEAISTTTLMPSFEKSLETPAEPADAAPAPADDPWAAYPKAETADPFASFPKAGETRGYDLTKLKATPVADLVKDRSEFNPVEFYARNTDELLADPAALKQVEDAYAEREKERMTPKEFLLKANPVYLGAYVAKHPESVVKAVKGAGEFIGTLASGVGQVFRSGGKAAGALSAGDLKETSARLAEAVAAFDSAQQHWVTTITSKVLPRPTDIRERLAYDADFKKKEIAAAAGNGEFARALGTDAAGLKASGVELDPKAIEKLATIEDPIFLFPVGGAIGVVSKGGRFLLGRAVGEAAAETFAKVGNAVLDRAVGGTIEGSLNLAGKAVEKAGGAVVEAGAKAGEALPKVRGLGQTTITSALTGHGHIAGGLAILRAAPTLLEFGGKAASAVGRGVQAAAPVAGKIGTEFAKGAGEAGILSVPLFIGSTPEEREALIGMVVAGGVLRAGGSAVGMGAEAGARAAQDKLAKTVFESVDRGPVKESPVYGTDQKLDVAHQEHAQNLTPGQQSVLNWTREFFRPAGIEVYSLDNKTFLNHVPHVGGAASAEGFFTTRGERVNADGTRQPVVQILLNGDTNGLGHELYHAFKSLDPKAAAALETHIEQTWHPVEQQWVADQYNAALNGGKPRSMWEVEYDKKQILEEAAAEVFGRVFDATDLSGVKPSVTRRAAEFATSVLEKMGYPLAGKGLKAGAGVSALGIRPSTSEVKISRDFLSNLTQRVKEGTLAPPTPAKKPIVAGSGLTTEAISRRPAAEVPPILSKPAAVALTPRPAAAPKAKATPVTPETPNIRVTPKEQLDYAAQRSKVTNAESALANAAKLPDPKAVEHVQTINQSMDAGHGVEIVHRGVIREGGPTPGEPVSRGTRRAEQEAAYIAEALGEVPESVREQHQKVLFGTRWQKTGKSGEQLIARSLDKGLANMKVAADMAAAAKVTLPYEVDAAGKLTEAGWGEAVQDLKDYWGNQDRGFRGDGEKLVRPKEDIGVSLPPEDPRGPVAKISTERTDFLNLIQGLNVPAAVTRQLPGKIPGNVKGQLLAELQGKKPAKPAAIKAADIKRQTYKPIEGVPGLRDIAEVNPLRNELRAAGADVGKLIEVTENVNLKDIESVTPRPDVPGRGGVTDITRAGFSLKAPEFRTEIDRVAKGESDGQTFNLDGTIFSPGDRKLDVVTLASTNLEPAKLTPEAIQEFVARYPEAAKNPDAKAGVFKLSDGRVSADLNVVVDQSHRKNTEAFARANGQEAIFDLAKGEPVSAIEKPATTIADGEKILKQTPEEWREATQGFKGGLTQEAYRLGFGLTDRADLNKLLEFRKQAEDAGKVAMAEGDFEAAMPEITKAQFFREAWEAAQGILSAKEGVKRMKELEGKRPPFLAEGESFSPATAKGKELTKKGYDFKVAGELGNRSVEVFKDGVSVGYAASKQVAPESAELAMTHLKKEVRGQGVGEALYRELFNQLQKDGVKLVEGMVVAPEPLALRNKIFGGEFERLEAAGEPTTLDEALRGTNLLKKGVNVPFPGIDVVNRIRPEDRFSVKSRKRETEKEAQKRIAETDYSKYNVPEAAKEVKTPGPHGKRNQRTRLWLTTLYTGA